MNRSHIITLVALLIVTAVGIGVGVSVSSMQKQTRDKETQQWLDEGNAQADAVLNAAGVEYENGTLVQR